MTEPELIISGLSELQQPTVARVEKWSLTFATVTTVNGASLTVQIDGEGFNGTSAVPIPAISLVDSVSVGDRVVVFTVPPNGNYVIRNATAGNAPSQSSVYAFADAQIRAVGGFFDITSGGVPLATTFTKFRDDSRILVDFNMAAFVGATSTTILGAVNINGFDYGTAFLFFDAAGFHIPFSSSCHIPRASEPVIPAGTYDVTMRWGRTGGGGAIGLDANCLISCSLIESPPE